MSEVLDLDPLIEETARIWVGQGWRVESRLPGQIVLVSGHRPNHVLHLLLSIVTLGLWLIAWLIVGLTGGERRRVVTIDQRTGLVVVRKS